MMRRTSGIVAATITLLVAFVATAQAGAAGFDAGQHEEILFYGNFDQGILLFAGGTAEDHCNEEPPTFDARVFTRRDGSIDLKVNSTEVPIYLYSSEFGSPPELIDATCAELDADRSVPLQPFADGEGRVRMRLEFAPDGNVHVVNSTVGAASAADGTTWRVRGWADLMIVDGKPVGDPSEFQGLRVTRTGR